MAPREDEPPMPKKEEKKKKKKKKKKPSILEDGRQLGITLLSASLAGVASRLTCHPLDTAKARLQAHEGSAFRGVVSTLSSTLRHEGVAGLYRGVGATLVGGAPAMALYMTSYEASKALLAGDGGYAGAGVHLTAGMAAEAISCLIFVPVDVIKERLQVQSTGEYAGKSRFTRGVTPYHNSLDALRSIAHTEGLRGIYKGYGATLLSYGPFSALYFLFYEQFKNATLARPGRGAAGSDITFVESLGCACTAGGLAGFLTSPMDLAKLRYQLQRGTTAEAAAPGDYRGMFDGLRKIYAAEGFRGFWRGAGARVIFFAPSTAVTMASMEFLKQRFETVL